MCTAWNSDIMKSKSHYVVLIQPILLLLCQWVLNRDHEHIALTTRPCRHNCIVFNFLQYLHSANTVVTLI